MQHGWYDRSCCADHDCYVMDTVMDPLVILALQLVGFTSLSGEPIYVNPEQVVSVRREPAQRQGHLPAHAHCILHTADGKFVVVQENCDVVERALQQNGWQQQKEDEP